MLERWRNPVFDETHQQVRASLAARLTEMAAETQGRPIYYERLHVLLAVASAARMTGASTFPPEEPPSDDEKQLGLPPDRIVEIGKQAIRRTDWLKRL